MRDDVFIDTNILVYTIDERDRRGQVAVSLLAQGGVVSVQVIQHGRLIEGRRTIVNPFV